MRTLSVIIPATDRPLTLDSAVHAIEGSISPPEQVIVIDKPTDLASPAARNLGARQAEGEILVFVDADVEVHEDTFVRIRAAFNDNPELAAVWPTHAAPPLALLLHPVIERAGCRPGG